MVWHQVSEISQRMEAIATGSAVDNLVTWQRQNRPRKTIKNNWES